MPGTHSGSLRRLAGRAAVPGTVSGRARIVMSVGELASVRQGDVVVSPAAWPELADVVPLMAALVTERGATVSHAVVVAREFSRPTVVGARDATRILLPDDWVFVDGGRGVVEGWGRA
jgi:pyruvate, water dikinase